MSRANTDAHGVDHRGGCDDCPAASIARRAFLWDVGLSVAAALAMIAVGAPPIALAEAVVEAKALGKRGAQRTYALPASDTIQIDADNEVIIARWQNRIYAFSLRCPHRGTRLEWLAGERRVFCPKHKARFLPDGSHESGRQSRSLDRYDISRQGSLLVAVSWTSALREQPTGAELTVLYVDTGADLTGVSARMRRSAAHDADVLQRNAGAWAGVVVQKVTVEDSDPAAAISRHAVNAGTELVILGTRASAEHSSSIWGSVSATVTRELTIPVLLVPPAVWRDHIRDIDAF
jgi:nitrite reductase/ring-hydroxylating ferredoxin subunit